MCWPQEVDAVLKALMQAWDKALDAQVTFVSLSSSSLMYCTYTQHSGVPPSRRPPSVMIAQIIRLYCMKQDLRRAW